MDLIPEKQNSIHSIGRTILEMSPVGVTLIMDQPEEDALTGITMESVNMFYTDSYSLIIPIFLSLTLKQCHCLITKLVETMKETLLNDIWKERIYPQLLTSIHNVVAFEEILVKFEKVDRLQASIQFRWSIGSCFTTDRKRSQIYKYVNGLYIPDPSALPSVGVEFLY